MDMEWIWNLTSANINRCTASAISSVFFSASALSEAMCRDWFSWFKDNNFLVTDKKRDNRPRKVEDPKLQPLLDEDDTQSQMLSELLGVNQRFSCAYVP